MPTRDEYYDMRIEILLNKLREIRYKLDEEMLMRNREIQDLTQNPLPRTKYDRTISMLEKLERNMLERIDKAEKRRHSPPSLLERMLRWE